MATAIPSQTCRLTGSPRSLLISADHTGCVATRAVALATDVYDRAGIQVAKCSASSSPAARARRRSRRSRPRSSALRRSITTGARTTLAMALRQKAIAKAGATVAAISGPEVDTAIRATTIRPRSRVGGRATPACTSVVDVTAA